MSAAVEKKAHVWERDQLDWYVEPPAATEALLTVERFAGRVFDPCCGQGNIVRTLIDCGVQAYGSDIRQRVWPQPSWFVAEADFLAGDANGPHPNIVMNPPFFRAKGAEAFIRHAIGQASAKVAAFVDVRFLAGADRANGLFAEHPPHRIWVITPRVSCPPGSFLADGGKAGNGSSDWCWLVWDLTAPAPVRSEFGWLRRPTIKAT